MIGLLTKINPGRISSIFHFFQYKQFGIITILVNIEEVKKGNTDN